VDLSYLKDLNKSFTGTQLADELTNYLNREFGDEAFFDLSGQTSTLPTRDRDLTIRTSRISTTLGGVATPTPVNLTLKASDFGKTEEEMDWTQVRTRDMSAALQKAIDRTPGLRQQIGSPQVNTDGPYEPTTEPIFEVLANGNLQKTERTASEETVTTYGPNTLKASYDYSARTFKFTDGTAKVSIAATAGRNEVFGIDTSPFEMAEDGSNSLQIIPNGNLIRPTAEQRYGIKVSYDASNRTFAIRSGTTGDTSSMKMDVELGSLGRRLFGFDNDEMLPSTLADRGLKSQPAVAVGSTPTVNVTNNFSVNEFNNRFIVTVDGVKGTVIIPQRNDYSVDSFAAALQRGINALGTNSDGVAGSVNGVKVKYSYENSRFEFTTGTASSESFIQVSGSADWGLERVDAGRGKTATWIQPTQHKDLIEGKLVPKFIDSDGKETRVPDGYTTLPPWSPVFLDKGELTFDTGGKLVSPLGGTQLETVYLAGGKGALTINIDYSASTQYSSPFAVLSQSQDGAPEGDLVGVTIGNDGLVSASYSNGTQKSLAKILLVNFSSPTGLRQIGDSSFLASAASGNPILGTAGTAGFGTIRAGATERSNVDLTQELVDLITAQRNFQANAKAIETSTTMTQAIINIRG